MTNLQRAQANKKRQYELFQRAKEEFLHTFIKSTFRCNICNYKHKFIECNYIQTHWYVSPKGCNEGGYWKRAEIFIQCPRTVYKAYNRVIRLSAVPYQAEDEFISRLYWAQGVYRLTIEQIRSQNITPDSLKDKWVNYDLDDDEAKRLCLI